MADRETAQTNGGGAATSVNGASHSSNGAGAPESNGHAGGVDQGGPNPVSQLIGAARKAAAVGQGMALGLAGQAMGKVAQTMAERMTAELDDRDPDYIRENLPTAWLAASLWFRGEVRNMGNIPEDRPVLLVGNHSGGNLTPDTTVFTLAFCTYFGVERPFYQLAHNLVLASPAGQILRRYGTVTASHENAHKALSSGAALLVYPGGDWEVHRPSWEAGKVDFDGRKGFIKLALNEGVPIVPIVSAGGQETALFLGQGGWLARLLRLDSGPTRLKVLPISIAPPWGLNVGDFLGHLPLPAKITIDVMEPIDLEAEYGPDPDIDRIYDDITERMQDTLDLLYAERRFPVLG